MKMKREATPKPEGVTTRATAYLVVINQVPYQEPAHRGTWKRNGVRVGKRRS